MQFNLLIKTIFPIQSHSTVPHDILYIPVVFVDTTWSSWLGQLVCYRVQLLCLLNRRSYYRTTKERRKFQIKVKLANCFSLVCR